MLVINTTLTTSGNSIAVRLPRELLRTSGLGDKVTLEAKKGKIIIRKNDNSRAGWASQIKSLIAEGNEPTGEFNDMYTAANDGLDSLPWDGPSFEDWQKTHGKIS